MALLSCRDVSLSYENKTVLSDVTFSVNAGDYLCIIGENGSGKSTLMKAMLNMKQASSGEILTGEGLKQKEIGYLPQQSTVRRDFPTSVWEVVLSGCLGGRGLRPYYNKAERTRCLMNLEKLGICDLKNRCFRELSGGQQQRVLLARALSATEKLLLLDEPVAGLDPMITAEFYSMIKKLNREGLTVILVSHDITSAVGEASHILHLAGKPLFFGKTADYIVSDAAKGFLGGANCV